MCILWIPRILFKQYWGLGAPQMRQQKPIPNFRQMFNIADRHDKEMESDIHRPHKYSQL